MGTVGSGAKPANIAATIKALANPILSEGIPLTKLPVLDTYDKVRNVIGRIWTTYNGRLSFLFDMGDYWDENEKRWWNVKGDLPMSDPDKTTIVTAKFGESLQYAHWVDKPPGGLENKENEEEPNHVEEMWIECDDGNNHDLLTKMGNLGVEVKKWLENRPYYDFFTTYDTPFSEMDMKETNYPNPLYFKQGMNYNFYQQTYEKYATDKGKDTEIKPDEPLLPDIAMSILEQSVSSDFSKFEGSDDNDAYVKQFWTEPHRFVTLYNRIKNVFKDVLIKHGEKIGEKDKGQYFHKWAAALDKTLSKSSNQGKDTDLIKYRELRNKHKNVVVSVPTLNQISENMSKKYLFPMSNEIEFATDTKTELADALNIPGPFTSSGMYLVVKAMLEGLHHGASGGPVLAHKGHRRSMQFSADDVAIFLTAKSIEPEPKKTPETVARTRLPNINSFVFYDTVFPLQNWFEQYAMAGSSVYEQTVNDIHMLLDQPDSEIREATESPVSGDPVDLELQFPLAILLWKLGMTVDKMKKRIKDGGKTRTYEDILKGKKAYSETLFYRITKHEVNTQGKANDEPIQTYIYPNSSEIDILQFIDTQVKYNKKYRYRVNAWQAVFGTEYSYKLGRVHDLSQTKEWAAQYGSAGPPAGGWYNSTPEDDSNNPAAESVASAMQLKQMEDHIMESTRALRKLVLEVTTKPIIKIFELPYISDKLNYSCDLMVNDKHPMPPEVKVIPYKGVNNRILFFLNSGVGEIRETPRAVNVLTEEELFALVSQYESQYNQTKIQATLSLMQGLPLTFRSDDHAVAFRSFRLEERPRSYNEFASGVIKNFDLTSESGNLDKGTSYAFVDKIQPNKKYYYMFTCKDVHGGVSNPSPIYEVEMVDEDGRIYPIVTMVDLEAPPPAGDISKPGKKYIHIMPTLEQSIVNDDATFPPSELATSGPDIGLALSCVGYKPKLGIMEEPLFNQDKKYKFKVRLTSKKTGKKIDINVGCSTEHIVTYEEKNPSKYRLFDPYAG